MSDSLVVMHSGIKIVYNEKLDKWCFELRGRERSSESLTKAKEAIDKPEPKEKTFQRTKAWLIKSWRDEAELYEVTSIAEGGSNWTRGIHYWITKNGCRLKEPGSCLGIDNDDTRAKVEQLKGIKFKIVTLQEELEKIRGSIKRLEPLK